MSSTTVENGFDTIVSKVDSSVRDLAVKNRELIREVYQKGAEVPWLNQNVIGYGVGPKKMSEHFCYIAVHHDHINLGFNCGQTYPTRRTFWTDQGSYCVTQKFRASKP